MTCEDCHSFSVCLTVATFSRQLLFSTNIDINKVRPVLISTLAKNCDLYFDRGRADRDKKAMAAGPDN